VYHVAALQVMEPEQAVAYFLAAHPYSPSCPMMLQGLAAAHPSAPEHQARGAPGGGGSSGSGASRGSVGGGGDSADAGAGR
jgi:uncharacterized membrane protein YgcG